ncbi:MAG: hypothetical protein R2771_13500 [Saprospiraceae bacterium]
MKILKWLLSLAVEIYTEDLMLMPQGIDKICGDYMGMLATSINGMALQSAMEKEGMFTRLVSATLGNGKNSRTLYQT